MTGKRAIFGPFSFFDDGAQCPCHRHIQTPPAPNVKLQLSGSVGRAILGLRGFGARCIGFRGCR
jgi:hypothetical protein